MRRKEVILTRTKLVANYPRLHKHKNDYELCLVSPFLEHRALKREGISRGVLVRVGTIGHQVVPKHLNTSMYYN